MYRYIIFLPANLQVLRKLLQRILQKPLSRLADKLSSSPKRTDIFSSLSQLLKDILDKKEEKGLIIPFEMNTAKFIILSDQHKGGGDLADDFRNAGNNYLAALSYYYENNFVFINLGDCEELWEATPTIVMEQNRQSLLEEARFLQANRYYRIFGNHDLEWKYAIQQNIYLKPVFGDKLKIHEGLVLETIYKGNTYNILLTHGHQGDRKSDGNAFSKWFVAAVWTPVQRYLEISMDRISDSFELIDKHNIIMYEWSATQQNILFISGHTHKPVFASLDHIDKLARQLEIATAENDAEAIQRFRQAMEKRKLEYAGKKILKTMAHPSYFNTGCCCFADGDITGIEIDNGYIRLVKWNKNGNTSTRKLLDEAPLFYIFDQM